MMEEDKWTETAVRESSEEYLETLGIDKVFNGDLGVHRGRINQFMYMFEPIKRS